jgi:hypothetical protein
MSHDLYHGSMFECCELFFSFDVSSLCRCVIIWLEFPPSVSYLVRTTMGSVIIGYVQTWYKQAVCRSEEAPTGGKPTINRR